MKTLQIPFYLFVFALFLSFSCSEKTKDSTPQDVLDKKIRSVEYGLINPVFLKGDEPFNIQERMNHYGVPGVSIAVINNFEIEWARSYGIMDSSSKEPVTNETLFQAGSISKPVAAYGALRMVEEGKVELEEPINDYLSTWKIPDNEFTEKEQVTLGKIVSHTAGLTIHGFPGYTIDSEVPELVKVLDGESPANTGPIRVFRAPGEAFKYSGGGYTIMQQMVIDQYGKPYPEIMQELVLGPIGMGNSTYEQPLPPKKLQMAATGYLPDGTMTEGKRHTYPEMAAAGLWTTATDLANFAIDLQLSIKGERNQVLSTQMAQDMTTPYKEDFIGLGIFLEDKSGDAYFNHGGWDEGFSSYMVAHRDKGYGVVVLTNSNHPAFISELVRGVARVYDWPNYLPEEYEPLEIAEGEFDQILGRFKYDNSEIVTVFRKDEKLFMNYLFQDPTRLFKISESDFTRRERTAKVRFAVNPEDDKLYLTFPPDDGGELEFKHPKMMGEEMLPLEMLMAGNHEEGEKGFLALQEEDPEDWAINEGRLNRLGYERMWDGNTELAISIFKVNVALYPESSNTYDSLGEAYMENGDNELAIKNYQISLEMDPSNDNARKMLEKLGAA